MSNSPEQSQAYNDEIDLADLIRALWQGKWLVIGVTLATLALGIAYLMITPKSYTASLEISALPLMKVELYEELNTTEFMPLVNQASLLNSFLDDFQSLDSLEQSIKSSNFITQQEDETDEEFAFRIRATANTFSISPNSKKTNDTNFILRFTTQKPKLMNEIVNNALIQSNQNVNKYLVKSFQRRKTESARRIKFSLKDLNSSRKLALASYKTNIQSRLAILDEQAKLARSIKLSVGSLSSMPNKNVSSVYLPLPLEKRDINEAMDITNLGSGAKKEDDIGSYLLSQDVNETPLYLRGFLVIEEEIKSLQSRQSPERFIPSLTIIDRDIFKLQQDPTIERAEEVFANTPIGTDQFSAASYDIALIEYESNTKTSLILALSIVLGGMLGIFVLLIRNVLMKQD
jgi:chain length determinant protein (polysaccharide antigen chain regulator)